VARPFGDFVMAVVETGDCTTGVVEGTLDYRSGQVIAGIDAAAQHLNGFSAIGVERIWADLRKARRRFMFRCESKSSRAS
jgi:hypothetical protein